MTLYHRFLKWQRLSVNGAEMRRRERSMLADVMSCAINRGHALTLALGIQLAAATCWAVLQHTY